MSSEAVLLYIDRYHLGDTLFLQALARGVRVLADRRPVVLCHGSGEAVERLFEARGRFPDRAEERLLVTEAADRELLERGIREAGKKLAAVLTDSVVPAVPLTGAERGLVRMDETGHVELGETGTLDRLLASRVVPVLSLLGRDAGSAALVEAPALGALEAFFHAIPALGVAFFARDGKLPERGDQDAPARMHVDEAARAGLLVSASVAVGLVQSGVRSFLVTPTSLSQESIDQWWELIAP